MREYYRVKIGPKSIYADVAYRGNFIAAKGLNEIDLAYQINNTISKIKSGEIKRVSELIDDEWLLRHDVLSLLERRYEEDYPEKKEREVSNAIDLMYTIASVLKIGDIVLCPDNRGNYYIGEVTGEYEHHKEDELPHRRAVRWYPRIISQQKMSEPLRNNCEVKELTRKITKYSVEIESLISDSSPATTIVISEPPNKEMAFALEQHLEEFLIQNWYSTELGLRYNIFENNGEIIGQQYPTDTGRIDILAISKDKKEILVIELKKGRASDMVVGQVQRYMGYIKETLAKNDEIVKGMIITSENDLRIKRAVAVASNIDFYTYKIKFTLEKMIID